MHCVQGVVSDVSVEQEIQANKARPLSSRSTRNLVRHSEFSFVINMSKSHSLTQQRLISGLSHSLVWTSVCAARSGDGGVEGGGAPCSDSETQFLLT